LKDTIDFNESLGFDTSKDWVEAEVVEAAGGYLA
jgi:hypothetical protein